MFFYLNNDFKFSVKKLLPSLATKKLYIQKFKSKLVGTLYSQSCKIRIASMCNSLLKKLSEMLADFFDWGLMLNYKI